MTCLVFDSDLIFGVWKLRNHHIVRIRCAHCNVQITVEMATSKKRIGCGVCDRIYDVTLHNPHLLKINDVTRHVERFDKVNNNS